MSTRAIIQIAGNKAKLYRHCDGYPGGVLPSLHRQVNRFLLQRGFWDADYLLARIAAWQMEEHGIKSVTGFGIMTAIPTDVEYVYEISEGFVGSRSEIFITCYEARDGRKRKVLSRDPLIRN